MCNCITLNLNLVYIEGKRVLSVWDIKKEMLGAQQSDIKTSIVFCGKIRSAIMWFILCNLSNGGRS